MDSVNPAVATEDSFVTKMQLYRTQIQRIIHFKKTNTFLPGMTNKEQRNIKNQAKTHQLKGEYIFLCQYAWQLSCDVKA